MKLPGTLPGGLARLARPAAAASLLPQVVTVVAAAAVAGQLALLAWKFVPAKRPPPPRAAPVLAPHNDLVAIARALLFGAPAATPGDGSNAPRTQVALVLAGTLAVRDPKAGLAIIGETSQSARLYAAGSTLPGGVRLHEVYADRVVLDRGGVLETLPLPRVLGAGGAGASAAARPSPRGNSPEPALGESVQRLVAQGPEVIGEVLRPMPMYANGQLKGFRVYAGRDRSKFAKLGLQPGDLVTHINGVPLGDAQHGMEVLRSLGNSATANVTLERGGAVQQLTINAAQVAAVAEGAAPAAAPPADAAPPAPPPAAEPPADKNE